MVYEREFSSKAGIAAGEYGKEGKYWLNKFSGEFSRVSFPYDGSRSQVGSSRMEQVVFRFSDSCTVKLLELSKGLDHRLYIILAAGLVTLLHKYTGSTDIIIGSPIFRQEQEANFINTVLALRHQLHSQMTFKQLLMHQVKQTILEAHQHQNYPIETLLLQLKMSYKKEFPLFDVVILLENIHEKKYSQHTRPAIIFSFNRSEGNIQGNLQYKRGLYHQETARRMATHFKRLMEQVVFQVDLPLRDIDIMSEEEKKQVTLSFNRTRVNYPADKTIPELFADEAAARPNKTAVTFEGKPVTYSRLNQESCSLALYLRSQGVKPEEPVALMAENSYKVITALLGILKAGAVYVPVNVQYPGERKKMILDDCHTHVLLSNCQNPGDYDSRVIDLDDSDIYQYKGEGPGIGDHQGSGSLAYIMYTSGSTGLPRGVMVEHRNVVRLVKNTNFVEFDENDGILLTGALEFDASTFEIWGALLNGLTLHLVHKGTLLSPGQLKQALNRSKTTTMWMTSPFFNQVSDMDIEIFKGLKNLLVGGDILSPTHINRVRKHYPGIKVINGYGPTENTTFSTTFLVDKEYQENIPIGKPINNSMAYILDSYYHPVPIGAVGELFVGGDGLSRGYLNNPALTAEKYIEKMTGVGERCRWGATFYKKFFTDVSRGPGGAVFTKSAPPGRRRQKIYRTGDLARWLPDENIEFLGRMDYQVKIRGYRVEPGEIETRLMQTGYIKEVVVITRESAGGEKYLCAYVVPGEKEKKRFDVMELKHELAQQLPDYMVPAFISELERIPLTLNGKVDHKALPGPEIGTGIDFTAPGNEIQNRMADIWAEVLKVGKKIIGIDTNFFDLGGNSLKATILISRLHKAFQVKIPLTELFSTPTIRELSGNIKELKVERFSSLPCAEEKEYYKLSSAQKRLYVVQQMALSSTFYNVSQAVEIKGKPPKEKLANTFAQLIKRHESLRTSFDMVSGEPVQRIHKGSNFKIEYYGVKREAQRAERNATGKVLKEERQAPGAVRYASTIKNFIRPFDLTQAPLIRVGLIEFPHTPTPPGKRSSSAAPTSHPGPPPGKRCLLIVDMHHIITDGTSVGIMLNEFMNLYGNEKLQEIRIQYKDFSKWQKKLLASGKIKTQEEYWKKQFQEDIPLLDLPTDYPRPITQGFEGGAVGFEISSEKNQALNLLASENSVTRFILLLALYNILLSKISSQENIVKDIVIGTPIAGRHHADLEKIVGMFVNTLVLRNNPHGEKTFRQFLKEVKENTLQAFENQEYQFEELVEQVKANRDVSRNPLFDVMFSLHNETDPEEIRELEIPGLKLEPYPYQHNISKFDLELIVVETGHHLSLTFLYDSKLFKKETVERLVNYFKRIVNFVVENPQAKIYDIDLIPGEEKKRILYHFNQTTTPYPKNKNLHELFTEQVEQTPDNIAVVGEMQSAERKAQRIERNKERHAPCAMRCALTYRELNEKSHQLAGLLIERGVRPDTIVGIMVKRSIEMIIGILGILKAGGAYLPIDPDYPEERIQYMLKDSNAQVLVVDDTSCASWLSFAPKALLTLSEGDYLSFTASQLLNFPASLPSSLAYVIYTSGTTGKPKGTLVEHYSIVNLVCYQKKFFGIHENERILQFSSICFDASVEQISIALTSGAALILIDKEAILDLEGFEKFISTQVITHIHAVPSFLNNIPLKPYSGLKRVISGGDICPVNLAQKWSQFCDFYNKYGPTETTVTSIEMPVKQADETLLVLPIGKPIANTIVYLLNKGMLPVPPGVAGELIIGGDGVARGYLNRPELTIEKFIEDRYTLRARSQKLRAKLYKTGDLARWLTQGDIEFLGRLDNQVKIRGIRIEPGEIESRLLTYNGIKETVVVAKTDEKEDKYLCAYIVSNIDITAEEVRGFLSGRLPDYMIPTYFIQVERIPLTPNGKVDRKALPVPTAAKEEDYIAPRSEIEKKLAEIWYDVLAIEKDKISIAANFFQLGGHSLRAAVMAATVHKALNIKIPLAEIFKNPTIRGLAEYIKNSLEDRYASIKPIEKKQYYILSPAQKRLYILQRMELGSTAYNMPEVIPLAVEADIKRLEESFKKLIERHESLRTSFHMLVDKPVQRVHDEVEFEVEYGQSLVNGYWSLVNCQGRGEVSSPINVEKITRDFIRPFDLSGAPLMRVGLLTTGEGARLLLVDMHHIISDGTSLQLLRRNFMSLYQGEVLSPLRIQYKDFSHWQNSESQGAVIKQQENYWLREYAGEISVLNLPLDYPRPAVQVFEGSTISFEICIEETRQLKRLSLESNTTLFMILLAIFNVLLSRLSGREDIIVGTPAAGRRHPDLEQIIGMFVNTLTLRNYPEGSKAFEKFLKELKERTLEAFENQEYQFEDLVERVLNQRDISRNPLFDIFLALHNIENQPNLIPAVDIFSSTIKPSEIETGVSKFDLELVFYESSGRLVGSWGYCTKLFKKETIQRWVMYFQQVVSAVTADRNQRLCQIEIITGEEKKQVLYDFNDTEIPFPKEKTIHRLFEEQEEQTPDHIAMVGSKLQITNYKENGVMHLTYRKLNEKSNRLAYYLIEKGIKPDTIVGIMMERSLEMIIGILAILKASGAYLPLDPKYPEERIDYMLEDSKVRFLVENSNIISQIALKKSIKVVFIDEVLNKIRPKGTTIHLHLASAPATSLAYIIYTSGTTGKPKGVLVQHQNVVPLVKNPNFIDFTPGDRLLLTGAFIFDITTFEIWWPLLNGLSLFLVNQAVVLNTDQLENYITKNKISILHLIPQLFNQLAAQRIEIFEPLTYFLVGGDLVKTRYVNKLRKKYHHLEILHMYGPSENTTFSTFQPVNQVYESTIPIGQPTSNSSAYILDKFHQLVPISVTGELVVGGDGVARGYLNNPELTADKFIRAVISQLSLVIGSSDKFTSNARSSNLLTNDRLYLTGDLARWLEDGSIEFIGRLDDQVKIRGYRIEPGEIENRMLDHPAINEAVVLVREDHINDKYLCAYFTSTKELPALEIRQYLSGHLPANMIPAYFMRLERMVLNPHGKINRQALPPPRVTIDSQFTPPTNEQERNLVKIWSDLLGVESKGIGIDTDFFLLGGHSLKATTMISRIQQMYQVRVPLAEVFINPTIRGLAQYMEKMDTVTFTFKDPHLVLLRETAAKARHLFLVHDGSGEVEGYVEFCQYLHSPSDFDWWGLRADIIRNNHYGPREITIQELSKHYIENIKKVQPQGPYYVAGWSLGGTIAFEMALQLEKIGEKISLLGLIDSPGPRENEKKEDNQFTIESESDWIWKYLTDEEIKEKVKRAADINQIWSIILKYLEENHIGVEIIKPLIPHHLAQVIPNYDQLGIKELIYYLNINRTLTRARALYIPSKKINTILHYFKASQSPRIFQDSWNDYCLKPIKSYEIPGNHSSIFKEPNVIRTAAIIEKVAALNFNAFQL